MKAEVLVLINGDEDRNNFLANPVEVKLWMIAKASVEFRILDCFAVCIFVGAEIPTLNVVFDHNDIGRHILVYFRV